MEKCFADAAPNRCGVLKVKKCEGCSFFKTKKQYEEDREKADKNSFMGRIKRRG